MSAAERKEKKRKKAGSRNENALAEGLTREGLEVVRHEWIDRSRHVVDVLIACDRRGPLPRPIEVQSTLALDDLAKMDFFLKAPPYITDAIRLYAETWSDREAPAAARMLRRLAEHWRAGTGPAEPVFLRVGPGGKWIGSTLQARIHRLARMNRPDYPARHAGIITRYAPTGISVIDVEGCSWEIARRHIPMRTRHALDARFGGGQPLTIENAALSLLPGRRDASGVPVFLPVLFTPKFPPTRRQIQDLLALFARQTGNRETAAPPEKPERPKAENRHAQSVVPPELRTERHQLPDRIAACRRRIDATAAHMRRSPEDLQAPRLLAGMQERLDAFLRRAQELHVRVP